MCVESDSTHDVLCIRDILASQATPISNQEVLMVFMHSVSSHGEFLQHMAAFQQIANAEGRDADHPLFLFRGTNEASPRNKVNPLVSTIEMYRDPCKTIHLGRMMFQSFKDKCQFPQSYSDWDILSFARHFGLPCRMLDWSSNSLVALWFAIHKWDKDAHSPRLASEETPCSVWVLQTLPSDFENIRLDEEPFPVAYGKTGIFKPTAIESRIKNQSSFMMRQVYEYKEGKKRTTRPCDLEIKPVDKNPIYIGRLWRIDISNCDLPYLDNELGKYGVSYENLFPNNPIVNHERIEMIVEELKEKFREFARSEIFEK